MACVMRDDGSAVRWAATRVALVAAACLGPAAAGAQEPRVVDAGMYRLWQGTFEAFRETFRETATGIEGTTQVPIQRMTLHWREERDPTGRLVRARMAARRMPDDTALLEYTLEAAGDSLHLEQWGMGRERRRWARAARADGLLPEQSVAAIAALVRRAGGRDTVFRVWSAGADSALPLTVTFHGDTAIVSVVTVRLSVVRGPDGRAVTMTIPSQGARAERFTGDSLPPLPGLERPRPDYGAPAGAAYTAVDVRVAVRPAAGDTFSLGCTFTRPARAAARVPAAITLTGSGAQDRDGSLWPLLPAYRPWRQVAARLAAAGIAVLRCDDRGFGASGGSLDSATIADFADDAAAQLAWLRARSDVDPLRLAVIGHSEGGITGPLLAEREAGLRALVLMAAPAKTMRLVVRDQLLFPLQGTEDLAPAERERLRASALAQADAFVDRPLPYLRWVRDRDPLEVARRVRTPTLVLQGALDRQVSAGQADTLAAAMRAAGNRDVTTRVFPRLNHLFLVSPTNGAPSEYPALTDTDVPAEVLDTLAAWLTRRLRR